MNSVLRSPPVRVALLCLLLTCLDAPSAFTAEDAFPLLPGLESAVEFWKQIFVRYGSGEAVFFDPIDPGMIYNVLRVPDNNEGRALIEKERARIIADYDLNDEGRVKIQRGAREQFIYGLKTSGRYMTQMQKIFREEGLPSVLAYLPFVESSFNVQARSSAGAVGMWQFMPDTGKKFLRISGAVDERRDPLLSTRAAARLLKENYHLFGNWPLAITAYNHGTEGLFRAISSVESDNLVDIIKGYQSPTFGFASKNFYAEFLAAVDIAAHSESYFPFLRMAEPALLHEVEIMRAVPLEALLKPAAISQNDFFTWNPALSPAAKVLPSGYWVKLPPEKVGSFLAAERRLAGGPSAAKGAPMRRSVTASGMRKRIIAINRKTSIKRPPLHHSVIATFNRAKVHRAAGTRGRAAPRQLRLAKR